MNFFKVLFIFAFVLAFTSCIDEADENQRDQTTDNFEKYEALYESINETYEDIRFLLMEEDKLYDEILEMYYKINIIFYGELVRKHEFRSQILNRLQDMIADLEELEIADWPEEFYEKFQKIKEDMISIQEILKQEFEGLAVKESDKETSIEAIEEAKGILEVEEPPEEVIPAIGGGEAGAEDILEVEEPPEEAVPVIEGGGAEDMLEVEEPPEEVVPAVEGGEAEDDIPEVGSPERVISVIEEELQPESNNR